MRLLRAIVAATAVLLGCLSLAAQDNFKPDDADWTYEVDAGDYAYNSGDYQQAEQHYRKSLDISAKLNLNEKFQAESLHSIGMTLVAERKYAEAEALLRDALALRKEVLPASDTRIAETMDELGLALKYQNKDGEAEPEFLLALAIWDRAPEPDTCHHGAVLDHLGAIYAGRRDFERAEAMYQRGLAVWERARVKCSLIASLLDHLGAMYWAQGKMDRVEQMYERAIPLVEKKYAVDEPVLLGKYVTSLATAYSHERKYERAEPWFLKGINILQDSGSAGVNMLQSALQNYVAMLRMQGRTADEEKFQAQIDALNSTSAGANDPEVRRRGLMELANRAQGQGDTQRAIDLLKEAVELARKLPAKDPALADTLEGLAMAYQLQQRFDKAEAALGEAIAAGEAAHGAGSPQVAAAMSNLASLYMQQQKKDDAEAVYKRQVGIYQRATPQDEAALAGSLQNLASLYFAERRYDAAEPLYQRAIRLMETKFGPDAFNVSGPLSGLAAVYMASGKYQAAEPLYRRELELYEKQFGADNPMVAVPLVSLAEVMRKLGRQPEADGFQLRREAIEARQQQH